MNRTLVVASSLFFCGSALAQPDPNAGGMAVNPPNQKRVQPQILLDSPENAARSFMDALAKGSELELTYAVAGARIGFYGDNEWNDLMRALPPFNAARGLILDSVEVQTQTENEASVIVSTHRNTGAGPTPPQAYTLQLRRNTEPTIPNLVFLQSKWRVVPPSIEEVLAVPFESTKMQALPLAAALALHDPRLVPEIRRFRNMTRLKLLALAALLMARDFDGAFIFDDAARERALLPYTKNSSVLLIVGTEKEKWHFNDNLSTKTLAQINDREHTVLFYDGEAPRTDKFNFRFDGKTFVAFADGHVRFVTKDQLDDAVWMP